ncbi:hypothetical protein B0E53_06501 [Micromonospora sp. MH33]|nr:hypothetical protein B0E53_06501 [Micromonospora sp. MH33]
MQALLLRRAVETLGPDLHRLLQQLDLLGLRRGLLDLHLQVVEEADRLLLDAVHHGGEHVEALALVLDDRVALGVRPQADALLEVVHLVEVLAPLAVDHLEQDHPLQLADGFLAELLLAPVVRGVRVLLEAGEQEVLVEAGPGAHLLLQLLDGDAHRVELLEAGPELLEVPVLGVALAGGAHHVRADHVVDHVADLLGEVLAVEHPETLGVDHLALLVEHLVVLEDVLPDLGVLALDLGLRALDLAGDHLRLDRNVLRDVEALHHRLDRAGPEALHQVVLEGQVEAGLARVTLPAGPTAELVVDPARLVALGTQHVEATGGGDLLRLDVAGLLPLRQDLLHRLGVLLRLLDRVEAALAEFVGGQELGVAAEQDVRTAAGHVGGDGDRALAPGLGDDLRLLGVELRVQHGVRDAPAAQQLGEDLGVLHRDGADQHRLALLVPLGDVLDDGVELGLLGLVDDVRPVEADHRPVRRDGHDADLVDLVELTRLGLGGTGHAGELLVEAEVVLEGDGGQGLVLLLDLHPLLGLDRLVHALVVAAAVQDAAGELVDDENLAVADDVVLVALVEFLGLDRVVHVADERGVDRLVEVVDAEPVLDLGDTALGDGDRALGVVDLVVALAVRARLEAGHHGGELLVPAGGVLGRAGDDQRGPRLVDEDRVDLVDHREEVAALDQFLLRPGHVVAQVVEAELVVGAVGDVALVGRAVLAGRPVGQHHAHGEAEELVHPAHPGGVALGQVVVHRDHVHALAGERVQVDRHDRGEGLALTGLHLGDVAEVQGRAAHHLDVVGPLAEHPRGGFPAHRERLGQQVVEGLTVGEPLPELVGHVPQLVVAEVDVVVLDRVDGGRDGLEPAHHTARASAKDLFQNRHGSTLP